MLEEYTMPVLMPSSPLVLDLIRVLPSDPHIAVATDRIVCSTSMVPLRHVVWPLGHKQRVPLREPYRFIQQLLLQVEYLEKEHKKGLLYFRLDHVVVLNGTTFLLYNLEALAPLKAPLYKSFLLSYPLVMDGDQDDGEAFISPLLYSPPSLPFTVPFSVSAHSFGFLCAALIDPEDRQEGTRLRYFLDRCLSNQGVFLYM